MKHTNTVCWRNVEYMYIKEHVHRAPLGFKGLNKHNIIQNKILCLNDVYIWCTASTLVLWALLKCFRLIVFGRNLIKTTFLSSSREISLIQNLIDTIQVVPEVKMRTDWRTCLPNYASALYCEQRAYKFAWSCKTDAR